MRSVSSFSGRRIRASTSRSTGPVHDVSRRFLARLRRLPTCAMQARLADQAHLLHASSNDNLATVSACTGITGWCGSVAARGARAAASAVAVLILHYSQTDREGQASIAAFLDTFQKLGWSDGRNIRIEYRWGGRCRTCKGCGGRIGPFGAGCVRGRDRSSLGRTSSADQHDPDRVHPGRRPA